MPRGTHGPSPSQESVAYGTLTRCGRPFQQRSAAPLVAHSVGALPHPPLGRPTPRCHRRQAVPAAGFGLFPGRSPLLGESSLLVAVLRCFSSRTARHPAYVFSWGPSGITRTGLPHSDTLGSRPPRGSPRRFVAWSRPSSAPDAKASTVCPIHGVSSSPTTGSPPWHGTPRTDAWCHPNSLVKVPVELRGFEPRTSAVQRRRSPD